MTRKQIDDQLRAVIAAHPTTYTFGEVDPCYAWGMMMHETEPQPCVDCALPDGHMVHSSGVVLCWRCAFWRHMGWCPQAAVVVERTETPAA